MSRGSKNLDIFGIFSEVQLSRAYHENYIKKLNKIYEKTDDSVFMCDFLKCLKKTLSSPEKNQTVDLTLDFIAKFCTSVDVSSEVTSPFLIAIFQFLFENHKCSSTSVRFNMCRLLDRIMNNLGSNASLEEDICTDIIKTMFDRIQDSVASVRVQAVLAVNRLQDPSDESCKVMKVLLYHLSRDPSAEVRCAIISKIFITKKTLTALLSRIRDVKDEVRRDAYLRFSRLSAQNFSIRQRQTILSSAFLDSSPKVKDCLKATLLPKWLGACNDNYVDFVRLLNIQEESGLDVAKRCLLVFFNDREILDLVEYMQGLLVERTIPYDKLSLELAFVWRILSEHIRSYDIEKDGEILEQILPELTLLVEYIKGFSKKLSLHKDNTLKSIENLVLQQLLEMTKLYDLADEVGRLNLSQLCISLLHEPFIEGRTACLVVDRLGWAIPDANERISAIVEVISDLREPFMDNEVDVGDLTQMRITETERTKLRERLEELNHEQSEAVEAEDFMVAKEVQLEIALIESKLADLDNSGESSEVTLENIDPVTLEKCLLIIKEMVDNKDVTKMTPTLCSLLDNFIRPAFQKYVANPAVCTLSLELMGIFCLLDAGLARKQFIIFCFLISSGSTAALKVVFDMILKYGLRFFNVEEPDSKSISKCCGSQDDEDEGNGNKSVRESLNGSNKSPTDSCYNVITLLATLLECETSEVRSLTAEGFCKLFLVGRLRSPKILASLITMWFSPKSVEDSEWRQRFGLFLSAFTVTYGAQAVLEKAFMPTLQLLFEPSPDSELAEVDPDSVAQVFVKLTNPEALTIKPAESTHNRLALKILNEVSKTHSKKEKRDKNRVLMRTLTLLSIQSDDIEYLNNIIHQTEVLINKFNLVGDKICHRLGVKFSAIVKVLKHEAEDKSNLSKRLEQTHISPKMGPPLKEGKRLESTFEQARDDVSLKAENESCAGKSDTERSSDSDDSNSIFFAPSESLSRMSLLFLALMMMRSPSTPVPAPKRMNFSKCHKSLLVILQTFSALHHKIAPLQFVRQPHPLHQLPVWEQGDLREKSLA